MQPLRSALERGLLSIRGVDRTLAYVGAGHQPGSRFERYQLSRPRPGGGWHSVAAPLESSTRV
jgi:hypothetical protein